MKQFIKKIFGIDKLEEEKETLQAARDKAVAETAQAQAAEAQAKADAEAQAKAAAEQAAAEQVYICMYICT